jgi:DNA-binding SARP family transcriptional activator
MPMAGGPAGLSVQLFGDAKVVGYGGEVSLTPLQLSLITLVYGHGANGLTRPAAAHLLWGANGSGKWRPKIRTHLLDIRVRVGGNLIDTQGDTLRPVSAVCCDLQSFESAMDGGSLQEAAALVRRGFISTSFGRADSYDDWRHARAARFLRDVRTRAFVRWSRAFEQGDWPGACDAAEAFYTLDPDDPKAVKRVIEARARLGLLSAAESAFTSTWLLWHRTLNRRAT